MVDDKADDIADDDADDAARKADRPRLHQEYPADIRERAAENLHDAYLAGPFIDRHDHRVGDRKRRDEKADRAEASEDHLLLVGLFLNRLSYRLHRVGVEAE